jgi:hypothetical protein
MGDPRAERFAQHIIDLGKAFNVLVAVVHGLDRKKAGAGMMFGSRGIAIAPVVDDETYAIALHELGHLLSPMGMLQHEMTPMALASGHQFVTERDVKLQLEEEYAAWDWARHYALEWTPAMDACHHDGITSYEGPAKALFDRLNKQSTSLPKGRPFTDIKL